MTLEAWQAAWPYIAGAFTTLLTVAAAAHAILHKRNPQAAAAWTGLILFVPVIGAALYGLLGINRIRRQARLVRGEVEPVRAAPLEEVCPHAELETYLAPDHVHLAALARAVDGLTPRRLLRGNTVEVLVDGEQAYPAMLRAIEQAEASITLSSYIFDNDETGQRFVKALSDATRRGIEVRCLIDALGTFYAFPPIILALRRAGIPYARFLPILVPWRFTFFNLRNHRKTLVVDGRIGFTGGMNIRHGHNASTVRPKAATHDVHFRVEGPIVAHLQESFAEDWSFTTREKLTGERWFPTLTGVGDVMARGITDGPDEALDNHRFTLLAALASARRSVQIVTPYFIPDEALITALNVTAMRGIEVDIILPERGNLLPVQWASTALLWQVLQHGCRLWMTPPPFDHSKLMVVDGRWSFFGSTNWDPRALRLNFEFNVECYDRELAGQLEDLIAARRSKARRVELADVDSRGLVIKLRDGAAKLFAAYL